MENTIEGYSEVIQNGCVNLLQKAYSKIDNLTILTNGKVKIAVGQKFYKTYSQKTFKDIEIIESYDDSVIVFFNQKNSFVFKIK